MARWVTGVRKAGSLLSVLTMPAAERSSMPDRSCRSYYPPVPVKGGGEGSVSLDRALAIWSSFQRLGIFGASAAGGLTSDFDGGYLVKPSRLGVLFPRNPGS